MSQRQVFVPCSREQARALGRGEPLGRCRAHALTPELYQTLGMAPGDDEDAEYAAMVLASVSALAHHGERLVLVAEVPAATVGEGEDPANGEVELSGLSPRAVQCFFTEQRPQPLADAAAGAVRGLGLDEAWEAEQVQQLLREGDMLWHSVEELGRLGEDG